MTTAIVDTESLLCCSAGGSEPRVEVMGAGVEGRSMVGRASRVGKGEVGVVGAFWRVAGAATECVAELSVCAVVGNAGVDEGVGFVSSATGWRRSTAAAVTESFLGVFLKSSISFLASAGV